MNGRLAGKRVLLTQADDFMGPATQAVFRREGAIVFSDTSDLTAAGRCKALVEEAGETDILVANLASPNFSGIEAQEICDDDWRCAFEMMVHPLHRLCRAVLPQMISRSRGKIVVFGSAAALKGMRTLTAYSAARGAQAGYVRALGVEVAPHNIQVNLIAQNYVENPVYYPEALREKASFKQSLSKQVPLGRLATAEEDALFALFLASDESDFFVGQVIPFSGGWVQ